jgi:hypothetical protein
MLELFLYGLVPIPPALACQGCVGSMFYQPDSGRSAAGEGK